MTICGNIEQIGYRGSRRINRDAALPNLLNIQQPPLYGSRGGCVTTRRKKSGCKLRRLRQLGFGHLVPEISWRKNESHIRVGVVVPRHKTKGRSGCGPHSRLERAPAKACATPLGLDAVRNFRIFDFHAARVDVKRREAILGEPRGL
jgi:hypothetical protein